MNKKLMCEKLSEDYADRASKGGANYDKSYDQYIERCMKREESEIKKQYKVQGLGKTSGFIISHELM